MLARQCGDPPGDVVIPRRYWRVDAVSPVPLPTIVRELLSTILGRTHASILTFPMIFSLASSGALIDAELPSKVIAVSVSPTSAPSEPRVTPARISAGL